MNTPSTTIHRPTSVVDGDYCVIDGDEFFKISNVHAMDEFFVSVVSAFDHWMFISSRGALTAGRTNTTSSLFPYYCADKIVDCADTTGPKTILRVDTDSGVQVWEPLSRRPNKEFETTKSLYKNINGSKIVFEEFNRTLELTFRYCWTFGDRFGFVRECELINHSSLPRRVELLDGIENILPAQIDPTFQLRFSNLGDAYKKSELIPASNLGVYYLSSIPSDRAEPNEGLLANVVWSTGLEGGVVLLSSRQVNDFREGKAVSGEFDIRGTRGAYLRAVQIEIQASQSKKWSLIAGLNFDQADVISFNHWLLNSRDVQNEIQADVANCDDQLKRFVAAADGIQQGNNQRRTSRHHANVMYNIMRGGIPFSAYLIPKTDFINHVKATNRQVYDRNRMFLDSLNETIENQELIKKVRVEHDADLLRIGLEYLPLTFSRRHGDPTRPWNEFSIDVTGENGERLLNYQGNWRDIFQNWEALALSFPEFAPKMVFRFLNASTADGYNPYRITKSGFEWERLDPTDAWSNIGYWGDHQIVYLLRLLERSRQFFPTEMDQWLEQECFSYANVPYRIDDYQEILSHPRETIAFDSVLDDAISKRVDELGEDGKLLHNSNGETCHVSMLEKLLVPALAKMSNFVPEGGIWLNTQRPEWNDANNALVGSGLSVVTACDLRKYFVFLEAWIVSVASTDFLVSEEVARSVQDQIEVLQQHAGWLESGFDDANRRRLVDELSQIGSDYRKTIYQFGLSEKRSNVLSQALVDYFQICTRYLDQTIRSNRRSDGLYHSYNLVEFAPGIAKVNRLFEMLEGQVSVLNSGLLSAAEAVDVLDALRSSDMYREDQQSYMLYPDRELPQFVDKNQIPPIAIQQSPLLSQLIKSGDESVVRIDCNGGFHFNGDMRNANVVRSQLEQLRSDSRLAMLIDSELESICQLYEETFDHKAYTGRSGTFFAYEGLGSIYWHMVSKLRLAVVDYLIAAKSNSSESQPEQDAQIAKRLQHHYAELSYGIGASKSPEQYGAIPTDPYSHTPRNAGAQQPGMTGQVKEDILARFFELGIRINNGVFSIDPTIFDPSEFTKNPDTFRYLDVNEQWIEIELAEGEFAYTICQVPIVYRQANETGLTIHSQNGVLERSGLSLSLDESKQLFSRDHSITKIEVNFPSVDLTQP